MLYAEALDYLYSLANFERVPMSSYSPETLNLDRMRALMAALGNPQERYRIIHVAGTKGKGSTSAFMASCLRQLGLKTGLYTSPHLSSFRERIQINGEMIAAEEASIVADKVRAAAHGIAGVTTFEAITAMGFLHFSRCDVDWAVVEVGLGGRLDATNIVVPQASVITSISYDHQALLGNTLAEIAGEKCGIIKPGVPVISQSQAAEALAVIERSAHERHAPFTMVGRHWRWNAGAVSLVKQAFEVKKVSQVRSKDRPFVNDLEGWYESALLGKHQIENATTVIATIDVLRDELISSGAKDLGARTVRDGLRVANWPGRFEILRADPPIIADGAHNIDSVNKLAVTLAEVFPGRRWVFIFGTLKDKDAEGMIKALNPRATRWIMTQQQDNPRAVPAERLLEMAQARNAKAVALPNLTDALDSILNGNDPVCIVGSVALVGEARVKWALRTGAMMPAVD
jgi:dihydrofolate synthase/folylpolyglutamate synthase